MIYHKVDYARCFFQKNPSYFLVKVGAHKGKLGEFAYMIDSPKGRGILVEPMPNLFSLLENNVGRQWKCVNAAIDEEDGEQTFYFCDPSIKEKENWPGWWDQGSSLHRKHVVKFFGEKYTREMKVRTLSWDTLLEGVDRVDVVWVDAEAHDTKLVQCFPFHKYSPNLVIYECCHGPFEEAQACKEFLRSQGYICSRRGIDMIAYKK